MEQSLAQVEAELREGTVAGVLRARQRLRSLVGAYPDRLDLRLRLADVYRTLGDPAQAGRWSYLADERDPREIAAFEKVYQSPVARVTALAWRDPVERAGTADAREHLTVLLAAAHEETGRPLEYTLRGYVPLRPWKDDPWWRRYAELATLGIAVLLMVLGLVTALGWVGRLLFG